MSWHTCERCRKEVKESVGGICTACLTELRAIEPGDAVTYRHGKGVATGAFVRCVFKRSGMRYRIKKPSGATILRTDMWKTGNKAPCT